MATTVQIKDDVYRALNHLKDSMGFETYDEVIRALLKGTRKMTEDYFGKYPKLKTFKRKELDRFD